MSVLEERIELHKKLWAGELCRPLLGFFAGGRPAAPYPDIDIATPAGDLIGKYEREARWVNSLPSDRVAVARVNYGTSLAPALAGADFRYNDYTSWAIPLGGQAEDLDIPPLDRELPLWRSYEEKLRCLAEHGVEGAVVTSGAMVGPMDILSALLGPERLCTEMMDAPDVLAQKADDCARLWLEVYEAHLEILGRPDGQAGFGIYLPGRGCLWSEDVSALLGPAQFEQFLVPAVRKVAGFLDTAMLHTHSGALACLGLLAGIDELHGVEISNDPTGPPLEAVVEAGVALQATGRPVMFSNWERPLSEPQVETILDRSDPGRTIITLEVTGPEEAQHYHGKVIERFGGP